MVKKSRPDSSFGVWQHVDDSAREISIRGVQYGGEFEVRLHDRFPKLKHHVICQRPPSAATKLPSPTSSR